MNFLTWIAVTWLGERHRFLGLDWSYLVILGFIGQFVFGARFLVQWIVSEKKKRSVVPISFWYLSILGGVLLGLYFAFRRDPVGLAGQLFYTSEISASFERAVRHMDEVNRQPNPKS